MRTALTTNLRIWHHLRRTATYRMGCCKISLFLASTVSALHRNSHIWNACHPLLVTYYCRVTVYWPGMEAKKLDFTNLCIISGSRTPNTFDQNSRIRRLGQSNGHERWIVCWYFNADLSKHQNFTTFCWRPKNSVNAENNESFIYILFKLYMQV